MARQKKETSKEMQAWLDFAELSKFLLNEDAPLNINETPEDSKFYGPARDMVEELELDWDNLTQDESNRVMINLLGDYFLNIQQSHDKNYIIDIVVREAEKKQLKEKDNESAEE